MDRTGVEVHATAAALLAYHRKLPIELRNPDAFGQNLVRPPLGHVNSGQDMTDAGEVASRAITEAPASSKIPSQICRGLGMMDPVGLRW